MNQAQFHLIADKNVRNKRIKNASFDVFFNGLTPYYAERKHDCPPGTVHRSVKAIQKHFDHCIAVASAK